MPLSWMGWGGVGFHGVGLDRVVSSNLCCVRMSSDVGCKLGGLDRVVSSNLCCVRMSSDVGVS